MKPASTLLLGIGIGMFTYALLFRMELAMVVGLAGIAFAGLNEYVEGV